MSRVRGQRIHHVVDAGSRGVVVAKERGNRCGPDAAANVVQKMPSGAMPQLFERKWKGVVVHGYGHITNSSRLSITLAAVVHAAMSMGSAPAGKGPSGFVASVVAAF